MRIVALAEKLCSLCNAESVLFIGYGKRKIFKLGFIGNESVYSDYYINRTVCK